MNYVIGIDIGSVFSKALILGDTVISYAIMPSGKNYRDTAKTVLNETLQKSGLTRQDISLILPTGCGAENVSGASKPVTEITCQARGVRHLFPCVRTIIDMGGQSTNVTKLDAKGIVCDFAVSERCAAGSGRFLQIIARVLDLPFSELGPHSLRSNKVVQFTTGCAVFTESEVISRIAEGERKEDILAGVHAAIAAKVLNLVDRVGKEPEFVITGGVAKDIGLVKSVEDRLGFQLSVPEASQITAALGAAFLARDRVNAAK